MREFDYNELKRRPRRLPVGVNLPPEQRVRRKPRDPDEAQALAAIGRARWALYIASGKVEIIGPRRWVWHLGRRKIIDYLRREGALDSTFGTNSGERDTANGH